MDPRAIKIEPPRGAAALAAGPFVLHAVTEIDADAVARLAQTQAEVHIGLALPIPAIESLDGAKRFHADERATGMGRFHFGNARAWPGDRAALKFFPKLQGLVAGGENPRRHQRLFVTGLRLAPKICLPKIHPSPVVLLKLRVA